MNQVQSLSMPDESLKSLSEKLFIDEQDNLYKRTDKLFASLMMLQWFAAIVTALVVSPRTWSGTFSDVHIHVWAALILGGIITILPVILALFKPGRAITRYVIAAGQALMSALLIHLSGGRIETHFHVFGSLALLAFYRDYRVLLIASLVVAVDHGLRGVFWPQSVYGVLTVEPWRWLEHTGWVAFEDIFLMISIRQSLAASRQIAHRQAELEKINEVIEGKITERTAELHKEIQERKQAEAVLAEANDRLQDLSNDLERSRDQAVQASRFKSEFLANMSHEIRTPLNAVVGMSDLLARTPLADQQREFASTINSSADVLLGIINDILDYSKIESGKLDLEFIDFDLVELVEGAAELVAEKSRAKQLSLSTYIDPAIPKVVRGDPGRIRQILLNFLSNSIKFTNRGEITIRAERKPCNDDGRLCVHFSVSDSGIGLNEAARERLFQPFTQADASITRKYGGTGLGLAISKRLVELMGGQLTVESTYGEGATFGFVVELEPCVQELPQPSHMDDLKDTRILIVDGPSGTQQALNAYISSWGLRCSFASDFDKAILMLRHEAAANDSYDLVFVTSESNESNLLQMSSEVRKYSQLSKSKLVLIGNSIDREFGQQALAEGFSAYLALPVRQSRLFDCIVNLILPVSIADVDHTLEQHICAETCNGTPEPRNVVLVVEDNAANQKLALLQLRELGLAAHAVGNGIEALEAVARTQYTLILMDCQMPEMDGYQATAEIRKKEVLTGTRTPIIAMTAHAMSSDRMRCLAAGMDDYISKPVTQKILNEVLERWLPRGISINSPRTSSSAAKAEAMSKKPVEIEAFIETYGEAVAPELVEEFVKSVLRLMPMLNAAIEKDDRIELKRISHELKGVSASFFAGEMAELSLGMENLAADLSADLNQIKSRRDQIEAAWNRVQNLLKERNLV